MGTYRIQDYPRVLRNRAKRLKNVSSVARAATFMMQRASIMAPHSSGETLQSIRRKRITNNQYQVQSKVSGKPYSGGKFYQNLWANMTPGSHQSRTPKMWWNKHKPTLYGSGPFIWTGTPGFFDIAAKMTRKKFKDLVIKELHNIISK